MDLRSSRSPQAAGKGQLKLRSFVAFGSFQVWARPNGLLTNQDLYDYARLDSSKSAVRREHSYREVVTDHPHRAEQGVRGRGDLAQVVAIWGKRQDG